MDTERDFFACRSLAELVRQRGVQVEHAAVWIARDAHPQLVPAQLLEGGAQLDKARRAAIAEWIEARWAEKDALIEQRLGSAGR